MGHFFDFFYEMGPLIYSQLFFYETFVVLIQVYNNFSMSFIKNNKIIYKQTHIRANK